MPVTLTEELILTKCKLENLNEVKNLNLWGSDLEDITIIHKLINVEVISFSVNKIKTLKPFGNCKKLTELYLRKNCIEDLSQIKYLQNCKLLKFLWLEENPVCLNSNYRQYTIMTLPQIVKLDNLPILASEREEIQGNMNKIENSIGISNKTPEVVKKIKANIGNSISTGIQSKYESEESQKGSGKKVTEQNSNNLITFNGNQKQPVSIIPSNFKMEDDYMSKFKNLDELTEFFSSPIIKEKNQDKSKNIFSFNDSLKGKGNLSLSNFKKQPQNYHSNSDSYNGTNKHIMRAINNLMEDMNLTQLNYLKRIIDKKLKGDPNSII